MTRRVLVDLSHFVAHPRASGIQRVLLAMVDGDWPGDLEVSPTALIDGYHVVTARETAAGLLRSGFERRAQGERPADAGDVRGIWLGSAVDRIPLREVPRATDAFLAAELTAEPAVLDHLAGLRGTGLPVAALFYDALPLLHPRWFPGWDHVAAGRYYRLVAELDDVAFISRAIRDEFEHRLARRRLRNAAVAYPGVEAGGPPAPAPGRPHLVCVGAVEPRKRTDVVVAAVEEARALGTDVDLTVIGGASTPDGAFLGALRDRQAAGAFRWLESAADAEVAEVVRTSTAMLYAGELEGYGLPPLEALAAGVPVITAESLPSLEAVQHEGVLTVGSFEVGTVAEAVVRACSADEQPRLRDAARATSVPEWATFVEALAVWLEAALSRPRGLVQAAGR
jgi:glycosyltransferase involved in cell wall biosynthesis